MMFSYESLHNIYFDNRRLDAYNGMMFGVILRVKKKKEKCLDLFANMLLFNELHRANSLISFHAKGYCWWNDIKISYIPWCMRAF